MLALEQIFKQSEIAMPESWAEIHSLRDFESLRSAYTNGATWANEQNAAEITELQQANKALSLQNEVLSAAFANSSKKEKDLMSDKAELLKLVKMLLQVETHSGWGLFDCVNDDGENYQSAHLERILARMETIVEKHKL